MLQVLIVVFRVLMIVFRVLIIVFRVLIVVFRVLIIVFRVLIIMFRVPIIVLRVPVIRRWFEEGHNVCAQRINWLEMPEPVPRPPIPSPGSIDRIPTTCCNAVQRVATQCNVSKEASSDFRHRVCNTQCRRLQRRWVATSLGDVAAGEALR